MRVSSPPYRWPCFYGMDTGARDTLLAANMTVSEIEEYLGVDSLVYLELDNLLAAVGPTKGTDGDPADEFCAACLTGTYPVEIPVNVGKHVLEQTAAPVASQPSLYGDDVSGGNGSGTGSASDDPGSASDDPGSASDHPGSASDDPAPGGSAPDEPTASRSPVGVGS